MRRRTLRDYLALCRWVEEREIAPARARSGKRAEDTVSGSEERDAGDVPDEFEEQVPADGRGTTRPPARS